MKNKLLKIRPVWWLILMVGFFFISFSFSLRMVREEMSIVQNLQAQHQELRKLTWQNRYQISALAESIQGQVQEPESLFKEPFPQGVVKWETRQTTDLPEGFRHHKVTMVIQGMLPETLETVFTQLENAEPAWRIVDIQLGTDSASLSGSLQLEALDKSPLEL